jgi:hypothetical protein
MDKVPTTLKELKCAMQDLWDEVDLKDFWCYTERLTYKLEDIIRARGTAIAHWLINTVTQLIIYSYNT